MGKQISLKKKTDVLSASEIGQYRYCSYAWWLQRCGYEPESQSLEPGKHVHVALGNTIDKFDKKLRYSQWYALLGSVVLCIAFLLVFWR
ncbi:Uncharacterised protein [uncultured archaeon]|nr:Uncharacterised protein [uncultured archaeon]